MGLFLCNSHSLFIYTIHIKESASPLFWIINLILELFIFLCVTNFPISKQWSILGKSTHYLIICVTQI